MKLQRIGVVCAGRNSLGMNGQETSGKVFKDEQGAPKVAGLLRNEPGALFFYSAPFFCSGPTNAILRVSLIIS